MVGSRESERLARAISVLIRTLLVTGRKGAPAEGKIPFNPLYFHLLRYLNAQGPTRPSVLAGVFGVSKTTLSTAAKALEKRNLLEKEPDPDDGRAHRLVLKQEGAEVVAAIERQDLRNSHAMLNSLDPDQVEPFLAAMERIAESLDAT